MSRYDLRPWPYISGQHEALKLTESEQRLMDLVAYWKGIRYLDIRLGGYSIEIIARLIEHHELYMVPTLLGSCLMLGPAGRKRYNLRPDNRPSVDSVMNHAYMAYAVWQLQEQGWLLRKIENKKYLMSDHEGKDWTIIGQARGHTSRSLRRIIKQMRLTAVLKGEGILIITPDLRRTRSIQSKNTATVQTMKITLPTHMKRRKYREILEKEQSEN